MTHPLLQELNKAQQQAAQLVHGPVLVLAGPGSGKTRVLTHRVAYLVEHVGIDPRTILAVTFTNKAAREMKERLEVLMGTQQTAALTVGTFHSLCARFLRRDIVHLERERDFLIYDADDQQRLMQRIIKALNLDEKMYPPRALLSAISSAKNELVGPPEYARLNRATQYDIIVGQCYSRYQALLRESNALDFDDLLGETVRLFSQHPQVLEKYHQRYHYLLVDEYQDTNHAQYVLVRQLASKHRNLFVVGDNDQSIYSWRGADIRNILEFEHDYPDAQVILLEQNYRSTQSVLDVAQALLDRGSKQKHRKHLWTDRGRGGPVLLWEGYDQNDEARMVADEIARLIATDGYAPGDCAVMYRTNAQSRALEEALITRGLRYQIIGGMRFYERKEVKDLLAYLRLCSNPTDNVSLERIVNVPPRGIGTRTLGELNRYAAEIEVSLSQAMHMAVAEERTPASSTAIPLPAPPSFRSNIRKALRSFLALLDSLIEARESLDLVGLLETIVQRLNVHEALQHEYGREEGNERWTNIQELLTVAHEYSPLPRETQLATLLEEIALLSDLDRLNRQNDAITCVTLHQAKGLEYPVVFLIGLEEGLLPHSRSMDERERLEEERRLFYVGVTRAKDCLYLLHTFRRTGYGRSTFCDPSRFLNDIPPALVEKKTSRTQVPATPTPHTTSTQRGSASQPKHPAPPPTPRQAAPRTRRSSSAAPATPAAPQFAPGQQVRHPNFGEGVVVSSKLIEGDEEVTVEFPQEGRKRLLATFAKLERLA